MWPANAENVIKNQADLTFLKSVKGNRAATFGVLDQVLAS